MRENGKTQKEIGKEKEKKIKILKYNKFKNIVKR